MPSYRQNQGGFSARGLVIAVIGIIVLIAGLIIIANLWERLDNSQIMVVQSPIAGKLTWHTTTGGIKWQGFGHVTRYPKRSQFWFSSKEDQGKASDDAIKTRFNDGGHATISGSFSWDMPMDEKQLTDLHTKYGSYVAIEQQLIRTLTEKAVYMTGPLMSSAESYASRRNDLLSFINDQMIHGVYRTQSTDEKTKDPMTGAEKTVKVVKLVEDENGQYAREDKSPVEEFGIKIFNLSFNEVMYDPDVEKQIQSQQQAVMQVQTAIANAKMSEQAAITAEKNGQANAATAKWAQEVIKATEVTKAEQEKQVAETAANKEKIVEMTQAEKRKGVAALDLETARLKKDAEIATGEGESKRRQLVMEADGALEKKLETYLKVNGLWADAYAKRQVPSVVMGENGGGQDTQSSNFMQMLTIKAAQDLALNMTLPTKTK